MIIDIRNASHYRLVSYLHKNSKSTTAIIMKLKPVALAMLGLGLPALAIAQTTNNQLEEVE
ncbi:hypothetical protein, partial [Staphylococcus aureus]